MQKVHLLSLPPGEWGEQFKPLGGSRFRADQVSNWVFSNYKLEFGEMVNLPKSFMQSLDEKYHLASLSVEKTQLSSDGTCKWMVQTSDGHFVECVLIPDETRNTVCLSSQVGCGMGCTFCSTAKMGFLRNLTLGEIVEQFIIIQKYLLAKNQGKVTNVVFMGMGEPLMNAEAVAQACDVFTDQKLLGLAKKRITVSTSGIPGAIVKWGESHPSYKLAISLNGSNNAMRSNLMPINRTTTLEKLLEAVDKYIDLTGERITFEYILIRGTTCTPAAAEELKKILRQRKCKINLIPLNAGGAEGLEPPTEEDIANFIRTLADGSFPVMVRKPRGADIAAACGQLVQSVKKAA